MNIGTRIKQRREELNMTQEDLAFKMGYKSKSSINKIEKGKSDIPQTKVVQFAKALDTTIAYMMGWNDEELNHVSSSYEESLGDLSVFDDLAQDENMQDFLNILKENKFSEIETKRLIAYANLIIAERGI